MSRPRVAITRALPDAARTAERLRGFDAEPIVAPLLEIEPRIFDADFSGAQALLFTSGNAVRSAAPIMKDRLVPVFAVGEATARAARQAGFGEVRSADGDVRALSRLVKSTLDPSNGSVVYLSGADVAWDLAGDLQAAGFEISARVVYQARVVAALPDAYRTRLDIVVFHSARAAHAFAAFGAPNAERLTAACLSQSIAAAARQSTTWTRMVVASAPQEEALWRALFAG